MESRLIGTHTTSSYIYIKGWLIRSHNNFFINKMTKYIKRNMVLLPMKQLSTRGQMTQKLTTIYHRKAFNDEQSPYRIVRYYKWPRNDNVIHLKRENYRPGLSTKNERKTNL